MLCVHLYLAFHYIHQPSLFSPPNLQSTKLRLLIYGQLLQVTLLSASSHPSLTASSYLKVRPHTKRGIDFPDNRSMNNYKKKA